MLVAKLAISACSLIAAAITKVSVEEHGNTPLFKIRLEIFALDALGCAAPFILDVAFFGNHPHLGTTVAACVAPAVSTLKKAAARSAEIAHEDTSASTIGMIGGSKSANIEKNECNNNGGSTTSAVVALNQNSVLTMTTGSTESARQENETTITAETSKMTKKRELDA